MKCSTNQLRIIALNLLLFVFTRTVAYPPGIEVINVTFCGNYDKTAKIKISPWPFIPTGAIVNLTVIFTPAVDVLDVTIEYEYGLESESKAVIRGTNDHLCESIPDLCNFPAGETQVKTISTKLTELPPFLKTLTVKARNQFFNEEYIMFLCFDAVFKVY
ncbi:uncharacterized protein [Pocillopora verrucosa]|uniref:uncharacterized protein n=1 Tax=Pocillopora verrucosa TaxID=203993 RepID=UPI002797C5D6|nr:uncharacterized protein LOC131779570 [Pocillopora verrucosa]